MKPNAIIVALLALVASALGSRTPLETENADLKKQLDAAKAERDAKVAELTKALEEHDGEPLTDEQKTQLAQLLDAAQSATPGDVAPPVFTDEDGDADQAPAPTGNDQ